MKTAKTNAGLTARQFVSKLAKQHPEVFTELNFSTPFELLVATILSAQCTDKRVNLVTEKLFAIYRSPQALAQLNDRRSHTGNTAEAACKTPR